MCITALQRERCVYRVTNTRITQKMFIYILFYIDLTVQLDRTIERLILQKVCPFFVTLLLDCMLCISYLSMEKVRGMNITVYMKLLQYYMLIYFVISLLGKTRYL